MIFNFYKINIGTEHDFDVMVPVLAMGTQLISVILYEYYFKVTQQLIDNDFSFLVDIIFRVYISV